MTTERIGDGWLSDDRLEELAEQFGVDADEPSTSHYVDLMHGLPMTQLQAMLRELIAWRTQPRYVQVEEFTPERVERLKKDFAESLRRHPRQSAVIVPPDITVHPIGSTVEERTMDDDQHNLTDDQKPQIERKTIDPTHLGQNDRGLEAVEEAAEDEREDSDRR